MRKLKQISGQTILSGLEDIEFKFNPNFAKNRDIRMVKNSVTRPVTPVLPIDMQFTPFAVHYEKIHIHLRESSTNSAKIHSSARKSEHLRINQIQ